MGVSLGTLLTIKNEENDIRCETYGQDKKTHLWAASINIYKEGYLHTCLVTSEPEFATPEDAIAAMEATVKRFRK